MHTFEHDGTTLAYDAAGPTGPDGGDPVLFLHGITGARSTWHDAVAALAVDRQAYALDLRGHGGSSRAPGTYDVGHWAGDVIAFLEGVVGRPAVLVGHSLGGVVTAEVIGRRPDLVRAALLEDPPLFFADKAEFDASPFAFVFGLMLTQYRDLQARGATFDDHLAVAAAIPALNGAGTMADVLGPDGTRRSAQASIDFDPDALAEAVSGTALAAFDPLRPLAVPVHVLRADPDVFAAFRPGDEAPFLAANPHATVELVPGASHLIHDEQPSLVLDRIRTVIEGAAAGGAGA